MQHEALSVASAQGDGLNLPIEYSLDQNYPNPFNPSTTINFALPQAGHVNLTVYNILGQEVIRLIDGDLEAGDHAIEWDSHNSTGEMVASGVYFYRLTADSFSKSKKMILLK